MILLKTIQRHWRLYLFGWLSLFVFSIACTSKTTLVTQNTLKKILLKGNGAEPQDLDPHIVTGVPEHHILTALFEGLVAEDPKDLSPVPGVAESWKISPDQKTYTFSIRPQAKWSNGEALTAQDLVYSWKRVLSPKLGSPYAFMLFAVENAEKYNKGELKDFSQVGVQAPKPDTLVVRLRSPTPYFLRILQHYSTYPVPRSVIEKFGTIDAAGTAWTRAGALVCNGPFALQSWEMNKIITVKKNPFYWDQATVKLQEIHFFPTESQQTEERNFRAGELHVTDAIPPNKIEVYQKNDPHLIRIEPYLGTYYYRINTTRPGLKDVRVRKALAMSIDREAIVKNITRGGQLPAFAFVPPNTAGFTSQHAIAYDLAKAKKLLAEAGYPQGKGLPSFEILYNTSDAHKLIAEAIQQMWKNNLGIQVTLANQEWKVYLDSQKKMNYDLSRASWIGDYPDPDTFLNMFVSNGTQNQTGWTHSTYDRLIAESQRTADTSKRYESLQKAEKILLDEAPMIPIYTYTRVYLLSPDVKGWFSNILDHHPYKYVDLIQSEDRKLSSLKEKEGETG